MWEFILKVEEFKVFCFNEDCVYGRVILKVNFLFMLVVVVSYIKYIFKIRIYYFYNMLWIFLVMVIDILCIKV